MKKKFCFQPQCEVKVINWIRPSTWKLYVSYLSKPCFGVLGLVKGGQNLLGTFCGQY